jgi:hypothetical protein
MVLILLMVVAQKANATAVVGNARGEDYRSRGHHTSCVDEPALAGGCIT